MKQQQIQAVGSNEVSNFSTGIFASKLPQKKKA